MGIPKLHSFVMKKELNSVFNIDIIQEIDNWLRDNDGTPTIVIDFLSFKYSVCNEPLDDIFGSRSVQLYKKIEEFYNIIKNKGANLVFFDDGPAQLDKKEQIIKRNYNRISDIFKTLDHLYENNLFSDIFQGTEIRQHNSLTAGIKAISKQFGSFHTSYHNECDKEVAAFATKVNAMAIISDDTDYLIFEGNWSIWSANHINFSRLTTKSYSKTNLQKYLKLTPDEMPLLATLSGNDIISSDLLSRFQRFLGNPRDKFINISRYIICNFRKAGRYEPEFIAQKIFGNINELPEFTKLIANSLNSYNIYLLNNNRKKSNDFLQRIQILDNDCYSYLLDLPLQHSISYFDVRTPQFEKYPSLYLDLIRRQIGVILQHKNDKTLARHIFCHQDGRFVYKTVHPEYPPILVPNLDDLYNSDKNDELKIVKLRLLAWILSDRLDVNDIKIIDKKYFCVSLTLYYMVENAYITVREADIFLHMIETVYDKFSTIINLPLLDRIDPRAFQLTFLYDKLYKHITHAISNCGLFELIEYIRIDGLYFHFAYNKMHDLPQNEQINAHLKHLRLYDGLC